MNTATDLLSVLDEFGITVLQTDQWANAIDGIGGDVQLTRGQSIQTYTVLSLEFSPSGIGILDMLKKASRQNEARRFLLTTEKLNARSMAVYRNHDIDYLDLAGNARIRFGDVYVDVQGRTLDKPAGARESRESPVNLFSLRRSQSVFSLLVWPALLTLPLRFTSEAAGVSMGIAFQTAQLLRDSGYIIGEAEPKLVRKDELIERWTSAYSTGLSKKLLVGRYRGDISRVPNTDPETRILVSGEFAVPHLLRPTTLTVYAGDDHARLISANRWRRDDQPNIEVRKKFWKDPRQILHEERDLRYEDIERAVPPLLIYADLMASGDGRQREAAKAFRNEHHGFVTG